MPDQRIPVTILTGFLGSGKTTLLNSWLQSDEMSRAAVIVNEFGDIGIDHSLIRTSNDQSIQLSTGCLCCTTRGDLAATLEELFGDSRPSGPPPFDRIVIETTGLADPQAVIETVVTMPVARHCRLAGVVTTVDAMHSTATLDRQLEARRQIEAADVIVITKVDLASNASELAASLQAQNPGARLYCSSPATIPTPNEVAPIDVATFETCPSRALMWLTAQHEENEEANAALSHHGHRHHHGEVDSYSLKFTDELEWHQVVSLFQALGGSHGANILRVKGILKLSGRDRPVVVHLVQNVFYPPIELPDWPSSERCSQLVFIYRGIPRELIMSIFEFVRRSQRSV